MSDENTLPSVPPVRQVPSVPFKPAFDRLLLEPVDPKTRTSTGLHLVETPTYLMGRVVARGDGILLQNGTFEVGPFVEGELVAYQPIPGTFHRMALGGVTYWVVSMSSIIGAFDESIVPDLVEPLEPPDAVPVQPSLFEDTTDAGSDADNDER